ncbi:putative protein serine/threonine kinase [Cavenderia fasciculata]|uniref:Protein kinase domain-containing protein n=1 Tax=Cavenderia fasciculata TaxID=261658 RepID=F4Q9V2_CACFS|nr:putative protein serine/threonine kinase [Cavenderia fasciculata]EGG15471.1 putative protein serine/threonine kinase [Cavenderia fasciculata]|eukprot:XP_004354213.1 putative protein serine/threonine kinase [Cavenderia fasciculata]
MTRHLATLRLLLRDFSSDRWLGSVPLFIYLYLYHIIIMGNNQSTSGGNDVGEGGRLNEDTFREIGKPVASFYDHKTNHSIVITRTAFLTYNEKTRQHISTVPSIRNISVVIYHNEYDIIVTGEDDLCIRVYRASTGQLINTLPVSATAPSSTSSATQTQKNEKSSQPQAHREVIKSLLLLDEFQDEDDYDESLLLLSGGNDGTIRLWNVETGELVAVYVVSNNPTGGSSYDDTPIAGVSSLVFDLRSKVIVAGCSDGIIRTFSYRDRMMTGQFEGHGRGAILNVVITNNGLLVSSSLDQTIRLWSLETGTAIAGITHFAQTLSYDAYRDVLFAGSSEMGTVTVIKIEQRASTTAGGQDGKSVFKKINMLDFNRSAVLHHHFNTLADSIIVTTLESNILFVPNVTGIPFDQKDLKAKRLYGNSNHHDRDNNSKFLISNHQQISTSTQSMMMASSPPLSSSSMILSAQSEKQLRIEEELDRELEQLSNSLSQLDSTTIEKGLEDLRFIEIDDNSKEIIDEHDETSKNLIDRMSQLSKLSFDLFDEKDDISRLRRSKFNEELTRLKQLVVELDKEYSTSLHELVVDQAIGQTVLHPEKARDTKELDIARRRQEIVERHRRELEEFDKSTETELQRFDQRLPKLVNRTVHLLLSNSESLRRSKVDLELALNTHISNSFPLIRRDNINSSVAEHQYKYHVGPLVSVHASNVFIGIENGPSAPQLVAIKMLPPGVPIQPPSSHPNLTNIWTARTINNQQSTNVVMEYCSGGDIKQFVEEFDNHTVPLPLVQSIVHQILLCLSHLHDRQLVIRDLSPSHVLIGSDHQVRLTHLGIMRALGGYASEVDEDGNYYIAPEILSRAINTSSDMWSLGVVLIFLLQTQTERETTPLFHGHDDKTLLESMIKVVGRPFSKDIEQMSVQCNMDDQGNELLAHASSLPVPFEDTIVILKKYISRADKTTLDFIIQLLQFCPHNRITAKQALNHSFFIQSNSGSNNINNNNNNSGSGSSYNNDYNEYNNSYSSTPSTPSTPVGSTRSPKLSNDEILPTIDISTNPSITITNEEKEKEKEMEKEIDDDELENILKEYSDNEIVVTIKDDDDDEIEQDQEIQVEEKKVEEVEKIEEKEEEEEEEIVNDNLVVDQEEVEKEEEKTNVEEREKDEIEVSISSLPSS